MKSQIILTVEHDETIDSLEDLANFLVANGEVEGARVIDYEVKVDVP